MGTSSCFRLTVPLALRTVGRTVSRAFKGPVQCWAGRPPGGWARRGGVTRFLDPPAICGKQALAVCPGHRTEGKCYLDFIS